MNRANLFTKLSAMGIAMVMLFAVGSANAAVLEINGLSDINPGDGSFTFDLLIGDIGPLANIDLFNLELSISGPGGAFFVPDTSTRTDPNYVFFGNSYDYGQVSMDGGSSIWALDGTNTGIGVSPADAIGKLLSRFTIDIASAIAGVYTVSLVLEGGNSFLGSSDFTLDFPEVVTFTFGAVVPIPAAAILLGSGLLGLLGFASKRNMVTV